MPMMASSFSAERASADAAATEVAVDGVLSTVPDAGVAGTTEAAGRVMEMVEYDAWRIGAAPRKEPAARRPAVANTECRRADMVLECVESGERKKEDRIGGTDETTRGEDGRTPGLWTTTI
mmetsp:Transcript_53840/g.109508  ORF Transcript_53840/g.109508 Transcript_53840/m.109508 type:complete len:121 (-) Transcript_53840:87-449(-)